MRRRRLLWMLPVALILVAGAGVVAVRMRGMNPSAAAAAPAPSSGAVVVRDQALATREADWPRWQGPGGDNHAPGAKPPLTWSETNNIRWRVPVGAGHASPIVVGERVLLLEEANGALSLACYQAADGALAWRCPLQGADVELPRIHRDNSHASSTPASDGERVFCMTHSKAEIRLHAVGIDGSLQWTRTVGPYSLKHGLGSSPILHRSLVIACADGTRGGVLRAFDRESGEPVWQRERPAADNYTVPRVGQLAGRVQLVTHGCGVTRGLDPGTGAERWRCSGPATTCANTPAFAGDRVIVTGGYPQRYILAIGADGEGDVTGTHVRWQDRRKIYVTTPLVEGGRLLALTDNGEASCYQLADGELLWREKTRLDFSASPVLAGGRIYLASEQGKTLVLTPGDRYQVEATNTLAGRQTATPAFAGGRVYLRTDKALYCIEQAK